MNIYEKNRMLESEHILLAMLLTYPKAIDKLSLSEEYFYDREYRNIYKALEKFRTVDSKFTGALSQKEVMTVYALLKDNGYSEEYCEQYSTFYAGCVLEAYRKRETFDLTAKYDLKEITYDEMMEGINDLAKLTIKTEEEVDSRESLIEAIMNDDKGLTFPNYPRLSDALRAQPGDVITFAGKSGYGKSAMLLNLYKEMSQSEDYKCHYFNLEVSPVTMKRRLVSITSGVKLYELKDNVNSLEVQGAINKMCSSDSYIHSGSYTVEQLKATVMNSKSNDKVNVVFVDHIGLIQTNNKNIRTEYDRITYAMLSLRSFALDNDILLVIASQFDRGSIKSGEIGMHSLKSSGEIENSSTHVIIMTDSKKYDEDRSLHDIKPYTQYMKFKVEKNRNGQVGNIEFYEFDKPTQIIYERKFD